MDKEKIKKLLKQAKERLRFIEKSEYPDTNNDTEINNARYAIDYYEILLRPRR